MADLQMPGYLDYGKMLSMNPVAYGQAMDQLKLAQLYQAEQQKQTEQKTIADIMANQQNEKMNPLRVENQTLVNQGLGIRNSSDNLDLDYKKAGQQYRLDEQQRAAALKLSDDDMKAAEQHVNMLLISGDPAKQQMGLRMQQWLPAIQAERRKHQMEMEKVQEQSRAHAATAQINADTQKTLEQMRIDAGKYKGKNAAVSWAIKFNSLPPATRIGNLRGALASGKDPVTGEPMTEEDRQMYQAILEQDQATLDAGNQARAAGGAGIIPQVTPQGSVNLQNRPPVSVNPKKGTGTKDDPIVLK